MSHATGFGPYAGAVKVREPVARPIDVVAAELLLSASQAFLAGVLMYLAIGVWADRGVGHGPVAIILALLGLVVGAAWVYWLMGGVGWPLAAANVPVSMFLGFALILGWTGSDLFGVTGVPLLLATLAAVYGILGGVFIESPRRWRWDQRQKLRPGSKVPRVSSTTRKAVAAVPRSMPRRVPPPPPSSELATRIERTTPAGPAGGSEVAIPYLDPIDKPSSLDAPPSTAGVPTQPASLVAVGHPELAEPDGDGRSDAGSSMPTERLAGVSLPRVSEQLPADEVEPGAIVLPTSVEPKAQRSPWAWAAPPEWNRDEDDEGALGRPSGRA